MRSVVRIGFVVGVVLVARLALADAVLLKDGRIFEGEKMERTEGGVKVHFEHGDVTIPATMIQDSIIAGGSSWTPTTPEEKEKAEKGLVPFGDRWMSPERRDQEIRKRLDEKREELEKLKELSRWMNHGEEKTKHFEFEYNVAPHIFEYYRDMMEAYFKDFAKQWKISQPRELGRLKVCFYANLGDFLQIGGAPSMARGYFKFVEPLELNFYYDRGDPRYTEEVMFHEANHYLQMLIEPEFSMPHFPGEALAEYYGASEYKDGKLEVGLIQEGRLTEIQTDIAGGEWLGLKEMVLSGEDYRHYTWGWSFAHFCMNDRKLRKKFEKYVIALAKDRRVKRERMSFGIKSRLTVAPDENLKTMMAYLGLKDEKDLEELQKEWYAYVKDKLKLVTARGKEKAAVGALNTRRPIRAKRLFKEAIEAGSTNPMTYHRYAELLDDDGKRAQAIPLWRKAIELDPLNARFYASLGKALHQEGKEEEGEKLMRLALEIDPDDPWMEFEVNEYLGD